MGCKREKHGAAWRRAIWVSLLAVLLFSLPLSVRAVDDDHQVLYISSYSYELESVPIQLSAVAKALSAESSVNYLFMDARNQSERAAALELCRRLDTWKLLPTIDEVIVAGDPALQFALRYQQDYFANLPILFLDVRQPALAEAALENPWMAGAESAVPFRDTLSLAAGLYPEARRAVCIGDGTDAARGMLGTFYGLENAFPWLEFKSLDLGELSTNGIRAQLAEYGGETILIYAQVNRDGDGNGYSDLQAAELLTGMTALPIFSANAAALGTGFLGGCVIPPEDMAAQVGECARRILDGEASVADVGLIRTQAVFRFDRRVMDRHGISRNLLPGDAEYLNDPFREAALKYRPVLLGGAGVIVLLTALLSLLLWDNGRRRSLIREVREQERRLQNLMDLVPGGICSFRVDEEARLEMLHFNTGFYQMLGYLPSRERKGGNPMINVHPDDRAAVQDEFTLCRLGAECIQVTFRMLRQDRTYFWMSLKAALAPEEDGERIYYGVFTDVDELKRLQENLEENERMLQAAMEHADVDYWIYEPKLRTLRSSRRACELFGVPPMLEDYPRSWFGQHITLDEDAPRLQTAIDAIDRGEPYASCEVRERVPGGDVRWLEVKMTSLYDAEGNRTRVLCTGVVCTQRHRDIERYERQNQRVGALLSSAVASARLNLTKNICELGPVLYPEFTEGLDGTADALFETMKNRTVTPEQREAFGRRFNRAALLDAYARGTSTLTFERSCRMGGAFRWLTVRADVTGNPVTGNVEANVYSFDIDDQKSMEQIIDTVIRREYLMILRIDLKADTARIFSSRDGQNSVQEISEAEAALLGVVRDSYAGDDLADTLGRMRLGEVRTQLEKNEEYTVYADCRNRSEEVRRLRYSFVWLDRDGGMVCCTLSDSTDAFARERRRSEALRAALAEARRADQAQSEFLSRMSHEIRTPMNAILGLTQLAREDTKNPEGLEMLEKIQVSGEYLLGLINDVLDMSRIESGRIELHPENVNPRTLLRDIRAPILPRMEEKGIRFTMDTTGIIAPYVVDRLRIQQIYINILSNAIKFSEPGSEISCTVHHEPSGEDKITSTIVFRDHGCGMSPKFLSRVFEPFEQESNGYQNPQLGTGLGLAIVKNLVEQMGGSITVKSKVGRGSEFTVRLTVPRGRAPEEAEEAPAESDSQAELAGRRILLAEDHPINTEIARRMLSARGILVEHAENGRAALERYLGAEEGYYDAILMDIRMPVMNGIEATKAIRAAKRSDAERIPIIAMTANAFENDRRETLAAGMNAHLSKPVRREELLRVLRQFLG